MRHLAPISWRTLALCAMPTSLLRRVPRLPPIMLPRSCFVAHEQKCHLTRSVKPLPCCRVTIHARCEVAFFALADPERRHCRASQTRYFLSRHQRTADAKRHPRFRYLRHQLLSSCSEREAHAQVICQAACLASCQSQCFARTPAPRPRNGTAGCNEQTFNRAD